MVAAQYDQFEDRLIVRFNQHPFWRKLARMSDRAFRAYLIQLSFLSMEFVKWEERAKLGLESEEAKEIVRYILREEIPQGKPTHKDELLHDLARVGIPKAQVLTARPSWRTRQTLWRLYRLVRFPQRDYDLRVMVTLRVAGEVMVAETYQHVVAEIERRFDIAPHELRFYTPHFLHDRKGGGHEGEGDNHANAFMTFLEDELTDEDKLGLAQEAAAQAMRVRYRFHDQFWMR